MKHLLYIVSLIFLLTGLVNAQGLSVTSTTPIDGAGSIALDSDITIVFDSDINASSATGNSITVSGSLGGNYSQFASYSVSGGTVTIDPSVDFSYAETITVTVTTQVQDNTTPIPNYISSDTVFTFTALGPPPQPSVVTTTPSNNAFNVNKDQVISIAFDTTMAGNGFDEGVIKIYGSISGEFNIDDYEVGDNNSEIDISGEGTTVEIDLDRSFVSGETITVILTTGVSSFNEQRQDYGYMASPYIWQFQVGSTENNALVKTDSSYSGGTSPIGIRFSDMDNDGDIDIITANSGSNNVGIFYNDGVGSFSTPSYFSTNSTQPENLVIGDFNRDGFNDIAVSSQGSNEISVATSLSNGTSFSFVYDYEVGFAPRAITTGDYNGDGRLDLAVTMTGSDSVAVLTNNFTTTNNGFNGPVKYEVGQGPIGIETLDFDNDGDLDLVATSHGTDNVSLLEANGNGTFQTYQNFAVGDGPFSVYVGDLDGDNFADLVTVNEYASTVSVLMNNEAGFDAKVDYSVGTTPKHARLVDVNGDGDLDILTVDNGGTSTVTYLENAGDGTFSLVKAYDATGGAFGFEAGDLNGDEIIDFVVGSFGNNFVQVVELYAGPMVSSISPAKNTFNVSANTNITVSFDESINTSSISSSAFVVQGSISGLHSGLFSFSNGDKTVTLNPNDDFESGETVTVSVSSNILDPEGNNLPEPYVFQFTVASASGYGDFANLTNYTVSATNTDNIIDGISADFNGDGHPDIVAVDVNNSLLKVFFNDGDGTFDDATVSVSTGSSPQDVVAADIDNDGDIDLLTANNSSAGFSIIQNNGDGTFATKTDISYSASSSIAVGDIDNDGDVDALLNAEGSNTLLVFLNTGSGSFSVTPVETVIANSMTDIVVVDAENDNYLDIATTHGGSVNTIYLLSNNGDGTFSIEDSRAVSGSPIAVAFGQPFSNKTFGVATSSGDSFFGTGLNTTYTEFVGSNNLFAGDNPQGIIVSNFDDLSANSNNSDDYLMANYDNASLSLLTSSTSTNNFTEKTFSLSANPLDLATADFDGDGRMDVVTFNNNGQISVLFNMDSTPPQVSSVSPVNNTEGVTLASDITITFDMAMTESSFDSSTVVITGNLKGQYYGSYSYSLGNSTLTIDPTETFIPGEIISVVITTGVKNSINIALASPVMTQFRAAGVSQYITTNEIKVGSGSTPYNAKFADVDGDSDLDLIIPNANVDSVSILFNDGSGSFSGLTQYQTGARPINVVTGDFDGTNGMDFAVTNFDDGDVSVFLNNGDGNSFSRTDYLSGTGTVDAVTVDIDRDGDTDIISLNRNASNFNVLLNAGDGTFSSLGTVSVGSNLDRIFAADIDSDNDIDIAVGGAGNALMTAKNNGDGTFVAATSTGFASWGAEFIDIDADGYPDLFVSDDNSNTVSVHLNDESGGFGTATDYTVQNARDLVVVDYGNDGDLDILVLNFDESEVEILTNNGSAVFSNGGSFAVGTWPSTISYADIDSDGDLDFVTSNRGSDNVSINFGTSEPLVTTSTATAILDSSVTLNGSIDANDNIIDAKFVYKLSGAGTFTDTLSATPSQVTGTSATAISADLTGLEPDSAYNFKVIGFEGSNEFAGSELSFTTFALPVVTSSAATSVTDSSATLIGTINARNSTTDAKFVYKLTSSGTYSDTVTATPTQVTGSSNTGISFYLTGLLPNTSYDFKALGENPIGEVEGSELTFSTSERAPYVVSGNATSIGLTTATINGIVSAQNSSSTAFVAYGTSSGVYSDTVAVNENPVNSGMDTLSVTADLTGLSTDVTYYFLVVAINNADTTFGSEQTFSTLALPIVASSAATSLSSTSATLNGTIDARNTTTDAKFAYKLSSSGTYSDTLTATPSQVTGASVTPISADLTSLLPNTSYDFKAIGENENGEVVGSELSFSTLEYAPIVTTNSATNITKNSVTLNAGVNAQNSSTNAFFEYGTTSGVYTDTVAANENPVNDGINNVSVTGSLTGLSALTKYYFRTFATNSGGTSIGEVDSVTTLPEPPVITSVSLAPNSVDAAADADIVINFDQAMDNTTISGTTILVTGSMRGIYTGSFTFGATSATFNPDSVFFPGEVIKVNVSTGVESSAFNEPISSFYGFSFVAAQAPGSEVFSLTSSDYSAWANPEQVGLADFNNDGNLDLVGTISGSTAITITRMNNGDGTFSGSVSNSLSGSIGVATGDINNDGYVDVIYTIKTGGIAIYWNNGSNPFNSGQTVSGSAVAQNVEVADINGDGYLDFIYTEAGVKVVPNNGSGSANIAGAATYGSSGVWDVSIADINDDNYPDIIASLGASGGVTVYTNDGDGTFTSDNTYTTGTGSQGVQAVDVNGDDLADIVVTNFSSDNISVLMNNGDGTFATAVNYTVADEPYDLIAFDINGDGYTDLATSHQAIDSLSTMLNNGDGTFADPVYYLTGNGPRGIAAGDVNNDGELDLITADYLDANHTVRLKTPLRPSLASSTPSANTINVSTSTNIAITFNIPVDVSSVDSSKITVIGSLTGEYVGELSSITSSGFTFNPDSTFKEGEFITVSLLGIESQAGIPMNIQTFDFVTNWPTVGSGEYVDGGTFESITAPVDMIRTDVDRDGDIDLLIAGNNNKLYVKLNNGDGSFASLVSYSISSNVEDIYLVDIDGDGDLDVMSAHSNSGGTDTYLNDGDGTFTSGFGGFGTLKSLVTTDIDMDGYIDVIGANPNDDYISFNRNQGNNSFQPPGFGGSLSYASGTTPVAVAVADLNGNGLPDIISVNSGSNNVSFFENKGDGTLADAVNYSVGTAPNAIVISDVDEDGYADLIVSNGSSDNVSVLINNGDGTFASAVSYAAGNGPNSIALFDFLGDGDIDLFITNADSDSLSYLESNGDGTFATPVMYAVGDEPVSVVFLDYDNDGDYDILVANNSSNTISILKRTSGANVLEVRPFANRHFVPADTVITVKFDSPMNSASLTSSTITVVGSLTGRHGGIVSYSDSVATFDPSSDFAPGEKITVTVTTNVEDANNDPMEYAYSRNFTVESTSNSILFQKTEYSTGGSPEGIATADFDNDGDNDIVITKTSSDEVTVFINAGDGTFSSGTNYSVGDYPRAVSAADVDNDGDIDLSVANGSSPNVSVLLNNGDGTFANSVNYTATNSLKDIKNADINGDGYMDIVLAKSGLAVMLNNGDGTFGSLINYSSYPDGGYIGSDLELADMDGDGILEAILVANNSNPSLQVLTGIGNGVFSGNTSYNISGQISDVIAADLNQDGYPDLAFTDSDNNEVKIFINNGDGTVDPTASIGVNEEPNALTASDFDGDGDLDIVVGNNYEQYVSIILNNGDGTFGSATTYATSEIYDFNSIVSADYDGDGQMDIAIPYSNGLNVLMPAPPIPAPTTSASNMNFYNIQGTRTGISVTNGDGTGRIFVMKEGGAVDFVPTDGTTYDANSTFGDGTDLGGGNYVLLNLTGGYSGNTVYGLTRDTDYYVAVYEFNTGEGQIKYRTTSPATGSVTTPLAPTQAGEIEISANFGSKLRVVPYPGNGDNRILAIREGAPVTWTPDEATHYAANTSFTDATDLGDGTKIVFNGSFSSDPLVITNLNLNETYHFALFEYYGEANEENYFTTPATESETTIGVAGYPFDTIAGNAASFTEDEGLEGSGLQLDDPIFLTDSITTELWVKPDSIGTANLFLKLENEVTYLRLGITAGGNFEGTVRDSNSDSDVTVTGTSTVVENQWYHVAISAGDGGQVKLFVNGKEEDSETIVELAMADQYTTVLIGTIGGESEHFYGDIDELRIWGEVRSESEIRTNRRIALTGFPDQLLGYWQFNDSEGNEAYDLFINEDYFYNVSFVTSSAPFGGNLNEVVSFQSGSTNIGNVQLTMTDAFDNPVDIQITEVTANPNNFPIGYNSSVADKFFVIDLFGDPGTFSANLVLTFGPGVITADQEIHPDSVYLYKRGSNETGTWTEFGGATSAVASSGEVTWSGITSFSQLLVVGNDNETPPPSLWSKNNGVKVFQKANYADYENPSNQDCMTENVCLTRANSQGIFNIVEESGFDGGEGGTYLAPTGTEWAFGTTDDIESLTFGSWAPVIGNEVGDIYNMVGHDMVVHLIEDNIYVDIKFLSWTSGGSGGGFTYLRGLGPDEETISNIFETEAGTAATFEGEESKYNSYAFFDEGEIELSDSLTVELWVKPQSIGFATDFLGIAAEGSSVYTLGLNASGNFVGSVYDNNSESSVALTGASVVVAGEWYHLAITGKSGGQVKLYVNGVLQDSDSIVELLSNSSYNLAIGGFGGGEENFLGDIDELRIWGEERSVSEIRQNTYSPPAGYPSTLVAYWQFNDIQDGDPYAYDNLVSGIPFVPVDLVTSGVPFGSSSVASAEAFQNGSVSIGNAALSMSDGFDNSVDVQVSEISADPNTFPSGYSSNLGGKYFVIELFGDPGTFSANLTLTFGSGAVTATQETDPSTLKLFKRTSTSTGNWTEFGGATSAVASTGEVTWTGITSFSQFAAVSDDNLAPPVTIWSFANDTVSFTKDDYVDYTQPENQDRISDNLWITRQDKKGIFNAAVQSSFGAGDDYSNPSPSGTMWALGTTDDLGSLTFDTWLHTSDWYPSGMVGQNAVLYSVEDNLYIDIKFTSWTEGDGEGNGGGGGFSYIRGGAAPVAFEIGLSDSSDVVSYNDSTFTFSSDFFGVSGAYVDSVLLISSKSTLSGLLFLDQNSNGTYDGGTDNLLTKDAEFSYIPSGSVKLRYTSATIGFESATIKLQTSQIADSVQLDFFSVEGSPSLEGTAGENGWYLLSNPFTTTVGELLDNIWTQGAPNSGAPSGDATLFTFSQDSSKYVAISTDLDTTKLAAGTGLLAYIFADDDNNAGTPLVNDGWPKTLTNYGTPFGSNVDITIKNVDHDGLSGTSGSEGFALLGNPYGWPLSADSVIATIKREDALANSYVYRWNPVGKQYQLVTTGAIEAYESFFVRIVTSGATANLSFDYDDADIATPLKQVANNPFELTLVHSESGLKSHSYLRFDEKASESIDPYDGYYLGSYAKNYANLYTQINDQRLTINNIPSKLSREVEFPMYLDATLSGEYNLSWNNEKLPKDFKFTLTEVATGTEIDLSSENSYSFSDGPKAKVIVAKDTINQAGAPVLEKDLSLDGKTVSLELEGDGREISSDSQLEESVNESKAKASSYDALFVLKITPTMVSGSENEDGLGIPTSVELEQNYPNPFNPTSMIQFGVPKTAKVQLEVFDILGRKIITLVNNETKQPGRYNVQFEARNLATGMYIYRLVIGDKILTKKMLLIK